MYIYVFVHILVFMIILVAGLLYWILLSASTINKIIKIQRTHTTKISGLPDEGQVEVVGMTGQKILETPIKNTPCVFWQLEVQEFVQKEKYLYEKGGHWHKEISTNWVTIDKKMSNTSFEITDAKCYISIQPEHAELILDNHNYIWDLDTQALNTLHLMGINTNNLDGTKKDLVIYERYLAPEHHVYAISEIHQSGAAFTRSQITAKVISDQDEKGVLRSLFQQLRINAIRAIGVILICFVAYIFAWIAKKYNIRK